MDDSFQHKEQPKEILNENKLWASNKKLSTENIQDPILFNHPGNEENKDCIVPDVRQMSLLKAVRKIKESGFAHTVHGSGIVHWQSPKPNLIKTCGSTCVIGLN